MSLWLLFVLPLDLQWMPDSLFFRRRVSVGDASNRVTTDHLELQLNAQLRSHTRWKPGNVIISGANAKRRAEYHLLYIPQWIVFPSSE